MGAQQARSLRDNVEPADQRLARLADVLALVERLSDDCGAPLVIGRDMAAAYAAAGPIARRRFDARLAETAAFAAAGIEILLRQRQGAGDHRAAARRLAREMRTAIAELMRLIRRRTDEAAG